MIRLLIVLGCVLGVVVLVLGACFMWLMYVVAGIEEAKERERP